MNRLLFALTLAIFAAPALAATSTDLGSAAAAFVAAEVEGASPERQEAIVACLVGAFDGLDDATVATMLAAEDFEDSLDLLVEAHPEREAHIETCEEL
ncbi:MAG: hypothetical protein J0H08_11490 [Rhizobiales bacterium]|nr:hypothetical protein [Hyphomicrobiales bacterium]